LFTGNLTFIVAFVNIVNYKFYMNNEHKKPEDKHQMTQIEDTRDYYSKGVYVRDDHCDWGSSGMNEFTKEYSENK